MSTEDLKERARQLAGSHFSCEDGWYSCPKSSEGTINPGSGEDCNCGANERAEEIFYVLKATEQETERLRGELAEAHNGKQEALALAKEQITAARKAGFYLIEISPDNYEWRNSRAEAAEIELAAWRKWGIVEVAVRNPQVADYCKHWEGRTEKAERELALIDSVLDRRPAIADISERYLKVERACTMAGRAEAAKSLLMRYKKALESLTPGGSEFVDDPERCAEWAKAARQLEHERLLKKSAELEAAERELSSLKADGWVRVEDRLPQPEVDGTQRDILVHPRPEKWLPLATYDAISKMWFNEDGAIEKPITHWRELPAPPEDRTDMDNNIEKGETK